VIIVTNSTQEKLINTAIADLEGLDSILGKVTRIRVDALAG
jgi:hypothetical protein